MSRFALATATLVALAVAGTAASHAASASDNRLLVVNGNTGHVIYDDGHDDLFCVTRRVVVGYTEQGRRIVRRTMRCR